MTSEKLRALVHDPGDDVAVVIQDVASGDEIKVFSLEGAEKGSVKAAESVALGHKIAVRKIPKGKEILKYGRAIGRATRDIAEGGHVHIQNLKSIRWGGE